MNKIKFYAIGLALIVIGFVACQKEELPNTNTSEFQYDINSHINYSDIKTKSNGFRGKNGSTQILIFKDMETIKATLYELEKQTKELDSAFVKYYSNLDEEALNEKEEEIGFDELKPLKDFEQIYGFNSLRKKIEQKETQWLNNPYLDEFSDPDDYIIEDIYVRTILNEQAEVMVGTSIYKFLDDGSYYEITDGNFETLKQINEGEDVTNFSNVIHHNTRKAGGCKGNKWKKGFKYSKNYRIKWKVGIYNYPWGCGMKSKVTSYKKKKNRWKKYRTYLKVGIEGKYCLKDGSLSHSTGWVYSDRKNKKSWSWKITGPCKTKSGKVHGYHYGNGISYHSTLNF